MLITFTSRADADVIMFGEVATQILSLIGKDPEDEQGIITCQQIPAALATLRSAAQAVPQPAQTEQKDQDDEDTPPIPGISLAQRLVPLQAMLQRSLTEGTHVQWQRSGTKSGKHS